MLLSVLLFVAGLALLVAGLVTLTPAVQRQLTRYFVDARAATGLQPNAMPRVAMTITSLVFVVMGLGFMFFLE